VNFRPLKLMSPRTGLLSPTRFLRSVVFPQPEPPMMKKISVGRTLNETPSSTSWSS